MVSNTIEVKKLNRERIREAIQRHEKCTKSSIAKETSLSVATCNTILNEMLESGEVLKIDQTYLAIGRPADQFAYNKDYQHVLAVRADSESGIYTIGYAVADALGEIIWQEIMHPEETTYEVVEKLIGGILERDDNIKAVGFGIPGVADNGVIEYCDIKALEHVDFSGSIREKFGLEAIVENDINYATYHLYNKLQDKSGDFAVIYFPTSDNSWVGCGFVVNGRILKGSSMFAGELSYAAEAFGVSKTQQLESLKKRASFRTYVAQILLMVIGSVNPSHTVLIGNGINQKDIDAIREKCHKYVSSRHIPEIYAEAYDPMNYIEGLIQMTLDNLQYPISL